MGLAVGAGVVLAITIGVGFEGATGLLGSGALVPGAVGSVGFSLTTMGLGAGAGCVVDFGSTSAVLAGAASTGRLEAGLDGVDGSPMFSDVGDEVAATAADLAGAAGFGSPGLGTFGAVGAFAGCGAEVEVGLGFGSTTEGFREIGGLLGSGTAIAGELAPGLAVTPGTE